MTEAFHDPDLLPLGSSDETPDLAFAVPTSSDHLLDCGTKPSLASVWNALPIPLLPPLPHPLSFHDPTLDSPLESTESPTTHGEVFMDMLRDDSGVSLKQEMSKNGNEDEGKDFRWSPDPGGTTLFPPPASGPSTRSSLQIGTKFVHETSSTRDTIDPDPLPLGSCDPKLTPASLQTVFVACSAENGGPDPISLTNISQWIATIGANTMDRDFPAMVRLGNGVKLTGDKLLLIQLKSIANCLPDIVKKINEKMNRNVLVMETVPQNLVTIGVTRRAYISKTMEAALLSEVCNGLHAISIAEIITNDMVVCGKASRSGTRSILIAGVKMSGLNFIDKMDPTQCPQAVRRNVVRRSEHNLKRLKEVMQELDKVPAEVRMKAICVLESVLRKQDDDYCSIIESYFSKDNDAVVKCCELPQASLREKANKVLSLLGGDLHSAPEKEDPTDGKSKPVPITQLPDLIDTCGLEDDEFGSSSKNLVDEGVGDLTSAPLVDELVGRMGKTTLLQHLSS